jgi:hypothetical protein
VARRYNCGCGKKRYRDESSAQAAAAVDERAYQVAATVYRCPGGLAWHVTSHRLVPETLRSVGRRLAYELAEHRRADLDDVGPRRRERAWECAAQMIRLGLARADPEACSRLIAVDLPGLRRVVQIGLDAYAEEATTEEATTEEAATEEATTEEATTEEAATNKANRPVSPSGRGS